MEPEVLGIAVAVVHGQVGEVASLDTVDDGIAVLLLHQDLVDLQDEVGAELGGDAVEIMVGRLVAVEVAGHIVLGIIQFTDPGAFDYLNGIGQNHGALLAGGLFNDALLQLELALGHFVLGLVAGPAELDAFLEGLGLIIHKVDGALAGAQDVLSGVGGVAAGKQHGIEILACNIVRLHQTVGAQCGGAILAQCADDNGGHGEEQGSLIEIVYHAEVFKTGHENLSFSE